MVRIRKVLSHNPGFTLLELLVAVALLSLVSVLLLSGLQTGARVWERSSSALERDDEVATAREFLGYWTSQAYPEIDRSDPLHPKLRFAGKATTLRMVVPLPQAMAAGGWGEMSLDATSGGSQLTAEVRPLLSNGDDSSTAVRTTLLSNVEALSFAYLEIDPEEGPTWRDEWVAKGELPALIRVSLRLRDNEGRAWPPLLVAPTAISADCEYDPLTRMCRGR